jgi:hypothetical protein
VDLPQPPGGTSTKWITVIVRSIYNPASPPPAQSGIPVSFSYGTNNWIDGGQFDIAPGQRLSPSGGLQARTVVSTVQEPRGAGGTNDTMLMVLEDDKPVAYDDDMGIERMSWLKLDQACGTSGRTCTILPMRRSNDLVDGCPNYPDATPGTTTVVWDEDVANGRDTDGDGLGDALEGSLKPEYPDNTSPNNMDTDGDGIRDGWEVLGIFNFNDKNSKPWCERNLWKFPYYGADPTQQDLFVEVDWLPACPGLTPNVCERNPAHGSGIPNKDAWQWDKDEALKYVERFRPDFRAHVDIGATGVADTYDYGDWGGATLLGDDISLNEPADKNSPEFQLWQKYERCGLSLGQNTEEKKIPGLSACQGFGTPELLSPPGPPPSPGRSWCLFKGPRFGMFHHNISHWVPNTWATNRGLCTAPHKDGEQAVHETGHFFGLKHWGKDETGQSHCKPNYFSSITYCGDPTGNSLGGIGRPFPAFSHGIFRSGGKYGGTGDLILNPISLDEGKGLGTKDPDVLRYVHIAFGFLVGDDPSKPDYGGIDWDDDGEIERGTTVQAYINRGSSQSSTATGPWQGDPSVTATDAQSFSGYSTIAIVPTTSNEFGYVIRNVSWDSTTGTSHVGTLVPSRKPSCTGDNCQTLKSYWGVNVASKVSSMAAYSTPNSYIVFRDANDDELYFRGSTGTSPVGGPLSNRAVTGPPVVIAAPDTTDYVHGTGYLRVYAGVSAGVTGGPGTIRSALYGWEIDLSTGKVANGGAGIQQYWEDGSEIYVRAGAAIAVTRGYIKDASGTTTERVVAAIPSLDNGTGGSTLDFAVLKESTPNPTVVVNHWERQLPDPFSQITFSSRVTEPGRVGLAYRPDSPANPQTGRFYVTWQTLDNNNNAIPMLTISRGNLLPADSTCTKAHALCFPSFGRFNDQGSNWPAGIQMVYAGGHVRAVLGAVAGTGDNLYFPHADGIFYMDQRDFNDYQHIKEHIPCALRHCSEL